MARIAGVDIPSKKRVEIGLTYIIGVGRTRAKEILKATGIDPNLRADKLTDADMAKIREYIDGHFKVEGDLRRDVAMSIKRLQDLGTYRGMRHRKSLPRGANEPRRTPERGRAREKQWPVRRRRRRRSSHQLSVVSCQDW
jgi:small subunit ribosomal protein S13